MSRTSPTPHRRAAAAFTLIEMIGVLAIMAILASVLVPNALRTMDRAAVRAEAETLKALGEQVKLYLKVNGALPNPAPPVLLNPPNLPPTLDLTRSCWCIDIGGLSDLAPFDIAINKRALARVYIPEPVVAPAPVSRILILSSMRAGLALPAANNITTAPQFQSLWQTADNTVPAPASWAGWNAWIAVANSGDFLRIERIDLQSIDEAELLAEAEMLKALGEQTQLYRSVKGSLPGTIGTWYNDLGPYSNSSPTEIRKNKRGIYRSYLVDWWSVPAQSRVIILSSMSLSLVVPSVNNLTQFDNLWNNTGPYSRYLLIERVNLHTETEPVTIYFNTTEATVPGSGQYSFRAKGATVDSGPFAIVSPQTFTPGTILTLYVSGTPNYTYTVGTTLRTFDLRGANWIPQP